MEGAGQISPDLERELDLFIDLFSDEPNMCIDEGNNFLGEFHPVPVSVTEPGSVISKRTQNQKSPKAAAEVNQVKQVYFEDDVIEAEEDYYEKNCVIENAEKRSRTSLTLPPPKIMKNDIRRYYSRMFMNTVNSADFGNIQNFFNTFMPWPSKFIACHDTSSDLKILPRIVADGPRQMGHYLLGCFVQYPDMCLSMKDCSIVTSTGWSGTRIVMNMEVHSTKIYNLSMEEWIPQLATLDKTYERAMKEHALAEASKSQQAIKAEIESTNTTVPIQGSLRVNVHQPAAAVVSKPAAVVTPCSSSEYTAGGMASCSTGNSQIKQLPKNNRGRPRNNENPQLVKIKSENAAAKGNGGKKRKATTVQRKRTEKVEEDEVRNNSDCCDEISAISASELARTHIPEAFVHGLFSRAELLPRPIKLVLGGTITFFLDENNHMQHMALDMKQINR